MERRRNCLLGFIFCVIIVCMVKAKTSELGRLKIKVNKLSKNHDALQTDVDKIWEAIIISGINIQEYSNRTWTDSTDTIIQQFISVVNATLDTMGSQKRELETMVVSVRDGLKREKKWQRESISNIAKYCQDIQNGVTMETHDLKKTIQGLQENNARNEQTLSNIEMENRELRSIITGMQNDIKAKQGPGAGNIIICEYKKSTISCSGPKRLVVTFAGYGRTSTQICISNYPGTKEEICGQKDVTERVKTRCDGKALCEIFASNGVFGDSCPGIYKYLEVTFECNY